MASGPGRALSLGLSTVAEISRAAGYAPPVRGDATPRGAELLHEAAFFTHDLMVYRSCPVAELDEPWNYELREPVDAEAAFQAQPYGGMKKMALARAVQRENGLSDRARDRIYSNFTVAEILAMLSGARPPPADPGVVRLGAPRSVGREPDP